MNKHEKKALEYERKHMPQKPTTKNLKKLTDLSKRLGDLDKEREQLMQDITGLRLPNLVVDFARNNPDLHITSTTDKMCSVFCASNSIKKMPYGASDVHIEGEQINFKVLLD